MVKDFNTNTDNNDEWLTPPYIIEALGKFDLDVCEPVSGSFHWIGDHGFNKEMDGLKEEWFGRVWCNPPYGKETFKWLERLSKHPEGGIALIFARTETKGFHRQIWEKAHSVFFFEGRLKFYKLDGTEGGTANAPSCLVSYNPVDSDYIKLSELKGRQIYL